METISWPKLPAHFEDPVVYKDAMLGLACVAKSMNRVALYVVHHGEWMFYCELVKPKETLEGVTKLNR